jgi:putative FmdB family regulatory protein
VPTYEYACKKCGEHLEVVQSFKDEPLTTCPNCAGELRKVFGNVGIVFKGSGFYKTDSRPKGKSESAASTSTASASSSDKKSDTAKSDTKSDTKKSDSKKTESTAAAS